MLRFRGCAASRGPENVWGVEVWGFGGVGGLEDVGFRGSRGVQLQWA